ncbi:MAG: DNA-binding GntR family transcriptional regulator [Paracoccaceae bacterium]|jgi:DNA-binding GntR family transcriptional regulator
MDELLGDLAVVRTTSLTSALEKQLERLIVQGELAPGERLNEIQLSTRFGTSRGPLREATRSLEAKGFVEVIRNRGVFVRTLSMDEALEIYEIRGVLFGLAGRLAALRIDEETLARLKRLHEQMEHASADGDFDRYYPLNLAFHDLIVEASRNKTLINEYFRLVQKMHLFRAKGLVQGGGLAVSNREHGEMLEALLARDPDRAFAAHSQHVERAKLRMTAVLDTDI